MFAKGTRVFLLTGLGNYPAGTEGTIVRSVDGDVCEVELAPAHVLTVSCITLTAIAHSVNSGTNGH
jgi:hypothetical protein